MRPSIGCATVATCALEVHHRQALSAPIEHLDLPPAAAAFASVGYANTPNEHQRLRDASTDAIITPMGGPSADAAADAVRTFSTHSSREAEIGYAR